MKRRMLSFLAALLLIAALPLGARAESYSFPTAGLRLTAQEGWTVILPSALSGQEDMLAQLGVDPEVLQADYAAYGTLFEVYLPEGIQVMLSASGTEQTAAWGAMETMSEEDKAYFLDAFSQPPYENTAWSTALPGYLTYDWTYQADGTPVSFAGLSTVRQGMLYTLTASGADAAMEALHAAGEAVSEALLFLGAPLEEEGEAGTLAIPMDIEDDGAVTPLALVDFWPVTTEDTTVVTVRTLPNTDVFLHTATDMLRNRADAEGVVTFKVSTRRETTYAYDISAQAEGRSESRLAVALERQLSAEEQEQAYRRTAKQIDVYGYGNLVAAPELYSGSPITLRGSVSAFADMSGYPCVLIYTVNPGRGVWQNPVWVMLTEAISLSEGDIRTVYGDLRGDTFPYTDENGDEQQAPVVIGRSIAE